MMKNIPTKLKVDSILESVYEVRFETSDIPEFVTTRLSDGFSWSSYQVTRLPTAEIPEPIRINDQNLKYQPLIEFKNQEGPETIRIGPNSIRCSYNGDYLGWESFSQLISEVNSSIFKKIHSPNIVRLGLRYINVLTKEDHLLDNINSLNISISLANKSIEADSALTYSADVSEDHVVLSKIISPKFVVIDAYRNSKAVIDIDVSTRDATIIKTDIGYVEQWVNDAHDFEKQAFFGLLPDSLIESLRED